MEKFRSLVTNSTFHFCVFITWFFLFNVPFVITNTFNSFSLFLYFFSLWFLLIIILTLSFVFKKR